MEASGRRQQPFNRFDKGGKGKGKGKHKGGKGKGKSDAKGKGKGKGYGGGHSQGKGNEGKHGGGSNNTCLYCGKAGHWKRDCYKFKQDQGHVRNVSMSEEQDVHGHGQPQHQPQQFQQFQQPYRSDTAYSQASMATATSGATQSSRVPSSAGGMNLQNRTGAVRRVALDPACHDMSALDDGTFDLTIFSIDSEVASEADHEAGSVFMVLGVQMFSGASFANALQYDMTCKDLCEVSGVMQGGWM